MLSMVRDLWARHPGGAYGDALGLIVRELQKV
jgi:hypothetical protein